MFVRWESQSVNSEHDPRLPGFAEDVVVRRFDAPEALDTRFHEVRTKSAINRVPPISRVPFEYTVNPYRGCSHGCLYCFARPTHEYLDLNAGRDFEKEIVVKVNVPEVLRAELARPSWGKQHIAMGTNTDPYQWVEGRYKLMRGIWEAMRDFANPCSILTKSPLLLRDKDLLLEIAERTQVSACLSVPTLEEKPWRATEPHTPHPRARLEAVAELNRIGIPTGILIAPLMPGINDQPEQVRRIVELATEAGAVHIGGQTLFLRGSVKEIFFEWLREHRPDLLERYERLYASGAYLPAGERRTIERAAGAPWARTRYAERFRHRGGRAARRRNDAEEVRPQPQQSLF
jgi:DNA repair photolyase